MESLGLRDEVRAELSEVFSRHPSLHKVILYGSRAKGTHHPGSDIDLCLVGPDLTLDDLYKLDQEIDELNLPEKVDLNLFHHIQNDELISHIRRRGIQVYPTYYPQAPFGD